MRVCSAARPVFAQLGCEVVEDTPDLDGVDELFQTLRAHGYALGHRRDLERHRALLKDTVVWNIERGLALTPADLARAAAIKASVDARVAAFFEAYDFLLLPVVQVAPFDVDTQWVREIEGVPMRTYIDWMATCYAISCTGLPAISVPCGFTRSGLPIGAQLIGHGAQHHERTSVQVCRTTVLRREHHVLVTQLCMAADGLAMEVAMARMTFDILGGLSQDPPAAPAPAAGEKKPEAPKEQMLDGMPESFVGPLMAHLVAHEVGHTLGLRHNFKASSVYTLAQINSEEVKGKKQLAGSVMDYIGTNVRLDSGTVQGDYCMTGVGPYDMWAIEYGYTFGDTKPILARVAEPELVFATDEDTGGPDPLARRYDFSKNPLDFANEQMKLVNHHRGKLLSDFIKDGDSWDRIRYGYEMILSLQTRSLSMMSIWVGGAHVNRDKKGDPNGRRPIEVVPAETQRAALNFVLQNAFRDEAFGLTPELTTAMGLDKWYDNEGSMSEESTWPIHDRIMGIQSSIMTSLLNPTTLRRVYDNEFRTPADADSLTLPELLQTITDRKSVV